MKNRHDLFTMNFHVPVIPITRKRSWAIHYRKMKRGNDFKSFHRTKFHCNLSFRITEKARKILDMPQIDQQMTAKIKTAITKFQCMNRNYMSAIN